MLPEVRQMFANIVALKNRAVALQQELTMITERGAKFEPFVKKKQELNSAVSELHKAIEKLEGTGVVIKSVDEGLLDFPSKRFEEEVWLCWKSGETEIKFWHAKNEGFTGRKPLIPSGFPMSEKGLDPSEMERLK